MQIFDMFENVGISSLCQQDLHSARIVTDAVVVLWFLLDLGAMIFTMWVVCCGQGLRWWTGCTVTWRALLTVAMRVVTRAICWRRVWSITLSTSSRSQNSVTTSSATASQKVWWVWPFSRVKSTLVYVHFICWWIACHFCHFFTWTVTSKF